MFDVKLMRQIDNAVGNLACSALAWRKRLRSRGVAAGLRPLRKIAVAKFFGMGSLVVASPAFQALRETYPDAEIHVITFSSNAEILKILGVSDKEWFVDTSSPAAFAKSTLEVAAALRKEKIDLLVDFEFFAKFPLVLAGLAGIEQSAGFCLTPEPWRKTLLDVPGTYNHYFHTKDIFLSLVYLIATRDLYYLDFEKFRARFHHPRVTCPPENVERVRSLLAARGAGARRIIAINPNTSPDLAPEVRKWPEERYAELASTMLREFPDTYVVFIGAKSEREYVERIVSKVGSPHVTSMAGDLSLRELLALFSISELVVSNDSGPMHLACLVDVPVVGLFFADTPTLFAPMGTRTRSVVPPLYSIPLFTVYNGKDVVAGTPLDVISNVAAKTVSVERVLEDVRQLMPDGQLARARGRQRITA